MQSRTAFGAALQGLRRSRGWSQLELARRAGASQRQLSFLETGRARPRAETVVRLADALNVSARECNRLLELAGLPPRFAENARTDGSSQPFHEALASLLQHHEPWPAFVLDGYWDVVDRNRSAARLYEMLGVKERNLIKAMFLPGPFRRAFVNWAEVADATFRRLLRERTPHVHGDEKLWGLIELARTHAPNRRPTNLQGRAVRPVLRIDGQRITVLSMIAHFGAPYDVDLEALRVEMLFPGDARSTAVLESLFAP